MRPPSLLSFVIAALVAACGSEVSSLPEADETAIRAPAAPERDLTLQAPAASVVEVASPVELSRPEPQRTVSREANPRPSPKPRPRPAPMPEPEPEDPPAPEPVAVPAVAVAELEVAPVADEQPAAGGRELAPGKTVTVIPASNGTVVEADTDDSWLPSERARGIIGAGGGTCRPRGGVRGIGIAGRIPVGVPGRRLR